MVTAVHDVSSGGLGVALAELCLASSLGLTASGVDTHRELFCEVPSRLLVATRDPDAVAFAAHAAGVPVGVLGHAGGDRLVVEGLVDVAVAELRDAARLVPGTAAVPDPVA